MSVNWSRTANQLQTIVTSLSTTVPGVGVKPVSLAAVQAAAILSALSAAGTNYDSVSLDGPQNQTDYAKSVATWWGGGFAVVSEYGITTYTPVPSASAAWGEIDRLARLAYSLGSSAEKATAASAFGVSGSTAPAPLAPDVTGATTSTLTGRVTAALAMSSVPATNLGLLSSASSAWTTILAARPAAQSGPDAASNAAIAALQAALANANAYIAAGSFK